MTTFNVTVKFRPIVRHDLGSSVAAKLPETLSLGEMEIVGHSEDEVYATQVAVSASGTEEAMAAAVRRVREALFVLATRGDGYEIDLWPMPSVETAEAPVQVTQTPDGVEAVMEATVSPSAHLGAVVQRGDYSKQAAAVSTSSAWPEWLRAALELNYLAVTAREDRPALVSHWSALEVVVNGTLGTPRALVSTLFGREDASDLHERMVSWLVAQGLNHDDALRMAEQARNAHLEGTLNRTRRCLEQLDVSADIRTLKSISRARGSVVHAESQPTTQNVRQALDTLRGWLQQALQTLLTRYV